MDLTMIVIFFIKELAKKFKKQFACLVENAEIFYSFNRKRRYKN